VAIVGEVIGASKDEHHVVPMTAQLRAVPWPGHRDDVSHVLFIRSVEHLLRREAREAYVVADDV
jgi:hypothetical protein